MIQPKLSDISTYMNMYFLKFSFVTNLAVVSCHERRECNREPSVDKPTWVRRERRNAMFRDNSLASSNDTEVDDGCKSTSSSEGEYNVIGSCAFYFCILKDIFHLLICDVSDRAGSPSHAATRSCVVFRSFLLRLFCI